MKKIILIYVVLIALFFTACARTAFKDSSKEIVHNENNIFN